MLLHHTTPDQIAIFVPFSAPIFRPAFQFTTGCPIFDRLQSENI
jgi:hypothetical protein